MLVLKIRCQHEIRRISLEKDPTFQELLSTLKKLYNVEENSNEELLIKYVDEDEDLITIATDTDLSEALRVYYQQKLAMLKLFLTKYLLTEEQLQQKRQKQIQLSSPPKDSVIVPQPTPTRKEEPVVIVAVEVPKKEEIVVPPKKLEEPKPTPSAPQQTTNPPPKEESITQTPPKPVEPVVATAPVVGKDNTEEELAKRLASQNLTTTVAPTPTENKQDDGEWIEFKTRTGKTVFLNLKAGSLQRYGIEPFTRVNTLKGPATVFGVDKDRGFLWFQLDKDQGVSFWDDITNHNSLLSKGVTIIEQKIAPPTNNTNNTNTTNPPAKNPKSSINNNSENSPNPPSRPPVWNASRASQYGFATDDEEARLIEMAVAESLKTLSQSQQRI